MSTSLIETIATTIVTRLQAIVTGPTYNNSVLDVVRPRRLTGDDAQPAHLRLVLEQDDPEDNEEAGGESGGRIIATDQFFTIVAYVFQSETSTEAIATIINSLAADIEVALSSQSNWWQFGAGAIFARLYPPELFITADGIEGFERRLLVRVRNREGSPYTAV